MAIKKAYVETPSGQLHYRHAPGPGMPLVFFHRTPANSASFEKMMRLMDGERPLYAFDTPGFGQSFDPPGMPSMAAYAGYMLAALDTLGLARVHIFAHHTGTHFATELAAAHPARVAALMLNGIAYLTRQERDNFRGLVKPPRAPDTDGAYLLDTWKSISNLFPAFDPELLPEEFCAALRATRGREQAFAAVCDQDYPATLARVASPILATCAEDDMWRDVFDRIFVDRPDAKRVLLGPAKFFTPEYDAVRAVGVIRTFLDEIEG